MNKSIKECVFICISLILTFVASGCNNEKILMPPLTLEIKLLSQEVFKDSIYQSCENNSYEYLNNKRYEVQIAVTNNTDSVIDISLMTCSWDENIIINTPFIVYSIIECNRNFPHSVEIKPHDKYILVADLLNNKNISDISDNKYVDLKMGLIFIPTVFAYDNIMNDMSSWNIIWSNPIKLDRSIDSE